jgi:hypothetical protein
VHCHIPDRKITQVSPTLKYTKLYSILVSFTYTLQGSNDQSSWTKVDAQSDQKFSPNTVTDNTYIVASPGLYQYYKAIETQPTTSSVFGFANGLPFTGVQLCRPAITAPASAISTADDASTTTAEVTTTDTGKLISL